MPPAFACTLHIAPALPPPLCTPAMIYVLGTTCSGKTMFFDWVRAAYPAVGLVEVGKLFRAKYPPSHFAGHSNPAHTAVEAWTMFESEVERCRAAGAAYILVDGQPRDLAQLDRVLQRTEPRAFLHIWAPLEVRTQRAQERDGHDPEKLALATARLTGDAPRNYDVISRALAYGQRVVGADTSVPHYSPSALMLNACWATR